ncbi:MAG TPA: DUF1565 domain-containing protein, partial [Bacteroidia bacterium]|nr:DUF1565 domain-containing protein [Bacteroidia bacterium]
MLVTPKNIQAATYASDSFARSDTGSWGSADIGGAYTLQGTTTNYNVDGSEGTMAVQGAGVASTDEAWLGSVSEQDVEIVAKVAINKVPTGDNGFIYLVARHQPSNNEYRARLRVSTGGGIFVGAVHVTAITSGSDTLIGSESASLGTYTANTYYWVDMQVQGTNPTTINIRAWKDGTTEPSTWNYTGTDSTAALQTTGTVGLGARTASSGTTFPWTFSYESLSVTDPIIPTATPMPTPTPTPFTSVNDTYTRTTSNGWGTADVGGDYTLVGTAADFSTDGNTGSFVIQGAGTTFAKEAHLDSVTKQDEEFYAQVKIDKIPTGDNTYVYIVGRRQANNTEYRGRLLLNPNQNFYAQGSYATAITSGGDNLIGTQTSSLGQFSPGDYIDARMELVGTNPTTFKMKAWLDGYQEPGGWDFVGTDSTAALQTSGSVGLGARTAGSSTNTPQTVTFDNFQVTDPATEPTPSSSITTYYVSTSNGSDSNPGTITQPFKTLKFALSLATPGDTFILRAGTYYSEAQTISLNGTSTNPITIESYPGEDVVIDGGVSDFATAPNNSWQVVDSSTGL